MKKIKKRFRIKVIKRGFITLYQAQIKTWLGWRSFYVNSKGGFCWLYAPEKNKEIELSSIENYRLSKGLSKNQISIIEVLNKKVSLFYVKK